MKNQIFQGLMSENEENKEIDMEQSPAAYRIAAGFLLLSNLIIEIIVGESYHESNYIPIIIDTIIAIGLLKLNSRARTFAVIRAVLGGVFWPIYIFASLGFNLIAILMTIIQVGFSISLVIILTGETKKWRIISSVAIFIICMLPLLFDFITVKIFLILIPILFGLFISYITTLSAKLKKIIWIICLIISTAALLYLIMDHRKEREDAKAWFIKGETLVDLERYEEALAAYDKALELNPNDGDAWNSKGFTLLILGRDEEALDAFENAIELNPSDIHAWLNKGAIMLGAFGRHEEALAAFDRVLELNPNDAEAWDNKGLTFELLGRYEEALDAFEKSLEIKHDKTDAWVNKGTTLIKLDRFEEALDAFEKALNLKLDYVDAHYYKAGCLALLDRKIESLASLKKAIELDVGCKKRAREDEYFKDLRNDPEFIKVTRE